MDELFIKWDNDEELPKKESQKTIVVPDNVLELKNSYFGFNREVEEIILPASIQSIGRQIFSGCLNLKKVTIDEKNNIYKVDGNCLMTKDGVLLEVFGKLSSIPNSVKKLGPWCLYHQYCVCLELPDSIEEICEYAFEGARINKVIIGSNCKKIASTAFSNTIQQSIVISPKNEKYFSYQDSCIYDKESHVLLKCIGPLDRSFPYEVDTIGENCFGETNNDIFHIQLPESVKRIEESAFCCAKVSDIELNENLLSIGEYAFCCTKISKLAIPNSVNEIQDGCFKNCNQLEEIELPNGISEISQELFYGCKKLNQLSLPSNIKTIGKFAFRYSGINNIVLNENVEEICLEAFSETKELSSISLPKSVKYIDPTAFDGSNIEKVIIDQDNPFYHTNVSGTVIYDRENTPVIDLSVSKSKHQYYSGIDNDGSDEF